jgi:hypothetical protein
MLTDLAGGRLAHVNIGKLGVGTARSGSQRILCEVTSAVYDPVGSMTWAETRALFGLDDVALKGLLSVKQSGSNAIERTAGIDAGRITPASPGTRRMWWLARDRGRHTRWTQPLSKRYQPVAAPRRVMAMGKGSAVPVPRSRPCLFVQAQYPSPPTQTDNRPASQLSLRSVPASSDARRFALAVSGSRP